MCGSTCMPSKVHGAMGRSAIERLIQTVDHIFIGIRAWGQGRRGLTRVHCRRFDTPQEAP